MSQGQEAGRDKGQGVFEANLNILAEGRPGLAELLARAACRPGGESSAVERPRLELLPSPRGGKGEPAAKLGGYYLHSAYDPRSESAKLLASALKPGTDCLIILGFGLGYVVEAALADPGLDRVIVAEAEPSLMLEAMAARDLSACLSDERLSFVLGGAPEGLLAALEALGARRIALLGSSAAEAAFPEWYAGLRQTAERFTAKSEINENTLKRFGRLWVRNLARNLPRLASFPGIQVLEGRFSSLPALVLAAGPSLDEVLPRLKEIRERCLLVAVDTALRSLIRVGIEPDFLVVSDPQYWNWRHLAGLRAPSSLLITEPAVYPTVLRFACRAVFLAESLYPLGRALGGQGRGSLGAGGSVATSAWDLARQLGASPIFMAGLDLGYPRGNTHAAASLFEQRALASGSRLSPAAGQESASLFSAPSRLAMDNSGGLLRSDARMRLYAWWFESRLARPGSPPTHSLSRRGSAIPGMPFADLPEVLALPPIRTTLDSLLAELAVSAPPAGEGERLEAARRALLKELELMGDIARRGRRLCESSLAGAPSPVLLEELGELDAALASLASRDVAGFLLPSLGSLTGGGARDFRESIEQSAGLYRGIEESADLHLSLLLKFA